MYYTVCSRLVLVHPSWMDQIGTGFWLMSALQQRLSRARFGGAGWLVGPDMYIGRIQRADGRSQQGAAGSGAPLLSLGPVVPVALLFIDH